jgi:nitroimidazol reductase NimA-like FMN-containing flavoprotein (pyridoxamine 5'-phosphate oxidase superfamily)
MIVGTPLTEAEIHKLLVEEKTCWLATISPNGEPHLIPIQFGFFDGNVHMIFMKRRAKSVRNVESCPSVCVGINVGERPGEIKCVLIHGKAKVIRNLQMLRDAYSKILRKYLGSQNEADGFLNELETSGKIRRRALMVTVPEKIISWKL